MHSDERAAYSTISSAAYTHSSVNHSLHFVDPITGTHTRSYCIMMTQLLTIAIALYNKNNHGSYSSVKQPEDRILTETVSDRIIL